ncbi:hypothetical protein DFP73DRAFT_532339 [Morchella snyderi]|nr:hypothetical protein DFP73DRAFT_532339 [Morchella snyderi]
MDTETKIQATGMDISIVYIGGDLAGGRDPVVGEKYELVLAYSTNTKYPIHGIQLHQDNRPSGWVREKDKQPIMEVLESGGRCTCVVTSTKEFVWSGDVCYWGRAHCKIETPGVGLKVKVERDKEENDGEEVVVKEEMEHEVLIKQEKEVLGGSDTE